MDKNEALLIYNKISEIFPDAHCELNFNNPFELLIATILSAQATDISVNKVTPTLFKNYPDPLSLSSAKPEDVERIIKSVGLAKTKAKNIILLSKALVNDYNGKIIPDFDVLCSLPGVGRKTANVFLAEAYNIPRIGVDTHVSRVSNRLGLSLSQNVLDIENDLMNLYPKHIWGDVHLKLLFFGRYLCKRKGPDCKSCPFKDNLCQNNEK